MKKDLINIARDSTILLVVFLFAQNQLLKEEAIEQKERSVVIIDSLENTLWYERHKFDSLQTCSDIELLVYSGLAKI